MGRAVLAVIPEDCNDRELSPCYSPRPSRSSVKATAEVLMPSAPHCCSNIEVWHPQAPSPVLKKRFLPAHELSHQQEAVPWAGCFHHEMLWLFIRNKQSICRMVTAFQSPLKS